MIIQEGHILLEREELVGERGLSERQLRRLVEEGSVVVARAGGGGHPALYTWASIPDSYKELVRTHLGGDPEALATAKVIEEHLVSVPADEAYLESYRASNGFGLPVERRSELVLACRLLALMVNVGMVAREGGAQAVKQLYGMSVMQLKATVVDYVKANRKRLPSNFPTSYARIDAKRLAYQQEVSNGNAGAAALIHGNRGNANSAKLATEEQRRLLRLLAARPQNYALTRTARDYNAVASKKGWASISADTVRRFLAEGSNGRAVTVYAKGQAAYHDTYGIVVHRLAPTQPTYLWVHDATPMELLYQKAVGGKTTYHHRKVVCVVLDPHTGYPVGMAIGDVDNIELSQAAFRDAVRHMHQLTGEYLLPHQVQSDRLGHKALAAWYEPMGITYTPAAARNARAKVIEPWFRQHNDTYVNAYPNWSGHNITSRKENQPNPDALNLHRKSFPNEATVIEQIIESIERHRAAKVEAYRAALAAMPADKVRRVTRAQYLEQAGVAHQWTNELTNRGLCPTIGGEELAFQLLDNGFQAHLGSSFQVHYDPADLSSILATTRDGSVRFVVPAFQLVPMALADHTPETRRQLADIEGFKTGLSQSAIDRILTDNDRINELAEALLADAVPRLRRAGRKATDDVVMLTPEQEVVTKAYLTEGGSHKAALRTAGRPQMPPPPPQNDIERWAEDQF